MDIETRPKRLRLWGLIGLGTLLVLGTWWGFGGPPGSREANVSEPTESAEQASQTEAHTPAESQPVTEPAQAYAMVPLARQQLIGVTTAIVENRPLETTVRAVGRIEFDERRITNVNLRISGWVEELFADYTGQLVQKGHPLFTLYSPDLVASQDEFLLALRSRDKVKDSPLEEVRGQAERLLEASRERLRLWTLTDEQIEDITRQGKAKTYLTIASPVTGHVIEKQVFKGMFVRPETRLYSIADLNRVWMNAEIYEYEMPFVTVGQVGTVTFAAHPGQVFHGRISYIYPYLNQETRTVKVRLEMPNPQLILKPEMYGTVQITVQRGVKLALPEEALLDSGNRKLAFVVRGEGLFEPREVKVGPKIGPYYEVQDGVLPGDRVVTSGNFLIDSDSKLMAATNMMGSLGMAGIKMEQAQMGKMDMQRDSGPAQTEQPQRQEKTVDGITVVLTTDPSPPRIGDNHVRIQVITGSGKVAPRAVSLTYTMAMPGMMPATVPMKPVAGQNSYEGTVNLGMAGQWDLTVTVIGVEPKAIKTTFSVIVSGGMPGM